MKFKIGELIEEAEEKKNGVYILRYEYMHGDADKYDEEETEFEDLLELEFFYKAQKLVEDKEIDDVDPKKFQKLCEEYLAKGCKFLVEESKYVGKDKKRNANTYESWADYFETFYSDIPGDCTCDHSRSAQVVNVEVVYRNGVGDIYEVNVSE